MGFINTALSGMNAASQNLEVIGNNISNSNTVGFKASNTEFADVYTGAAYGGGTVSGSGVASRVRQSFTTGTLTPTNNTLDLAINGPGFFVLNNNGATSYTRNGQFKLDDNSNIVSSINGRSLVGVRGDGTYGPLRISTQSLAPKATSLLEVGLNLNSSVGITSTPPSTSDIPFVNTSWTGSAGGSNGVPNPSTYNNTTNTTVYDSLGNAHVVSMYFIKANTVDSTSPNAGSANTWYVGITVDGVDASNTAAGDNSTKLNSLTFGGDGSFISSQGPDAASPSNGRVTVTVPTNVTNGAAALSFDIDFSDATQFGSPFAVQSLQDNGYTTGNLTGLSIDTSGRILGRYTNGQTPLLGTVQIANFADPEGLQNLGDNTWAETFSSGKALISNGGSGTAGQIQSGATEDSTVDLTGSLVKLTVAQRAFQANAQTIKVGDALIQTLLNSI
jgi:flagellar hook protein FlgE